jgi:signal transduction histidine kinase
MRPRITKLSMVAMFGYGFVVLLLAGGMILTAWRFDVIATGHVNRIRTEENRITLVERLRWSGEAIVSTGRGYLISADSGFLARLNEAKSSFDHGIEALTKGATDARSTVFVREVEENARQFREHQEVLVEAMQTEDARALAHRFEAELVPLQKKLGSSLDRLIGYKEAAIDTVYDRVAGERTRLRTNLNALLAILLVGSLAIAAYVASLLGRSFRKEQGALETARKALAARDEIMGVVAHDLRTPLSAISMRSELLQETADLDVVQRHAEGIFTLTRRMEGLIRSMLDVTTIESGHFTVRPETCEVEGLLQETTEMLASLAAPKQVTLERLPAAVTSVRADKERVLQVLANLVGNAIKFAPKGGRVEVAATKRDHGVCFSVSDNGPGIDPEHLPHVFDRFWKHEAGGKKGTGLGLFIAKGIVEAHGGRIWVESEPGQGATFRFTLPSMNPARPPLSESGSPVTATSTHVPGAERRLQHGHS